MTDQHKVTWAEAFRDITIKAMDKGQLPILFVCLIFITVVAKMPPEELAPSVSSLINKFIVKEMIGYVLFTITLLLWFLHAKFLLHIIKLKDKHN